MIIIPSLVEPTAQSLFCVMNRLIPFYQRFQIDIQDGVFITNKTLSVDDFVSYLHHNDMGKLQNVYFDFHLMENAYESSIKTINKLSDSLFIDTVFIHTVLRPNYERLQNKYPRFKIGLVINPEENIDLIVNRYNLSNVPMIQLMTIHPGPQGQPFIPDVLQKIERLRMAGFNKPIYIDGAINEKTVPIIQMLEFRPDVLCPGSYLAKTEELEKHVEYLRSV